VRRKLKVNVGKSKVMIFERRKSEVIEFADLCMLCIVITAVLCLILWFCGLRVSTVSHLLLVYTAFSYYIVAI